MKYQRLGKTPYLVSRICLGVLTMGPLCANLSIEKGAQVIKKALACGINFFDTAEYYETYPYLKEGLKGWDQEVIIASKSYAETVNGLARAVEDARIALDRERIEIFLLHEQRSGEAVKNNLPLLEYLHTIKARGLVGAVGISTHDVSATEVAAQLPEVEVIHPMFNKAGVGIQGGGLKEMTEAIKLAEQNGKGIYGMKAIGGGSLMKQARTMLEWTFNQDFLHSVAIGMKDELEVATNVGWLAGENPPEEKQLSLVERNLVVEKYDLCTACGECVKACHQGALKIENFEATWEKSKCLYCGYCIPACERFCLSFA
ncbi:MAG: aldo/keto reductase [Bacillota bacterium]